MTINLVYMTAGTKAEAETIGSALVKSKLAACVNIIDQMNSIYMWEGGLQQDAEVILIAKTTEKHVPDLINTVKALHSYDCPCIVSLPVSDGNPAFLDWVIGSVQ